MVTSLQLQNGLQKGPTTKCIYSVKCEKQLSNLLTIFSLVFCEKETAAAVEEGISRGLYYHLLWATCVFKRQCGGAEKLECLQNAKDHNSESTNSERLLKRGKFQSRKLYFLFQFRTKYGPCIQRDVMSYMTQSGL